MTIDVPEFKYSVGDLVKLRGSSTLTMVVTGRSYCFDAVGELGTPFVRYECVTDDGYQMFDEIVLELVIPGQV